MMSFAGTYMWEILRRSRPVPLVGFLLARPISAIGGMKRIEQSATQLDGFIDSVRAATGASRVDVVGHSEGTLVPAYYAKYLGGATKINSYISLAPVWSGTTVVGSDRIIELMGRLGIHETDPPPCAACGQITARSDFIAKLNSGGSPYLSGIAYTNIATRFYEYAVPYTNGIPQGAPGDKVTNLVVQDTCSQDFSDHLALAASPRGAVMVLNALDPEHPQPIPCRLVLPITG